MSKPSPTTRNSLISGVLPGALALIFTSGCATSGISPETADLATPAAWARGGAEGAVRSNWLDSFESDSLNRYVDEAQRGNFSLAQERARFEQAEQAVVITRANRYPDIGLSVDGSRISIEDAAGNTVETDAYGAQLDAAWEVDVWGRLSRSQQAAQLAFGAQKARLELAERNLAARVAGAVFDALEARALFELSEKRLQNAAQSRDIVASGYRQGLNDALDLYLANNQVEQEEATLALRDQLLQEALPGHPAAASGVRTASRPALCR